MKKQPPPARAAFQGRYRGLYTSAAIGILLGSIAIAGSSVISAPPQSSSQMRQVADLAGACQAERVQAVAAGLAGGVVVSEVPNGAKLPGGVKYTPATDALPAHCQVTGSFVTNPKTGKTANFLATFPANWNGKYLQMGCGGHCGMLVGVNDPASPVIAITNQGEPGQIIKKGYAAFATDEGHEQSSFGGWAVKGPGRVDEDSLLDFYYRANQVLATMGKSFTTAFYSQVMKGPQNIRRSYFNGCSGGGRDALVAANLFPEQFDGIIAGSPYGDPVGVAFQYAGLALASTRTSAAGVTPALMSRVDPLVKAQCDAFDGVKDGIIQNPAACNFRPQRDLPRCVGDKEGPQCFTKSQIESISTLVTAVTDEQDNLVQPGFSVSEMQANQIDLPARGPDPEDPWPGADGGMMAGPRIGVSGYGLGVAVLKIFVNKNNPNYSVPSLLSFRSGGAGQATDYRIVVPSTEAAKAHAATRSANGLVPEGVGKLIKLNRKLLIWNNLSDQLLTPYMVINYYKRLASRHGGYERLQRNIRYFPLPGTGHCGGGAGPSNFDALSAIEDWVEKGRAPEALIAMSRPGRSPARDTSSQPPRTMPLCKFPEMARYKGTGDVNVAANWTCPPGDKSMLKLGDSGRQAGVIR